MRTNLRPRVMEDEIEATQRQLRRSAALIQDAFEGLSTLHNRVAEVSAMRAQDRTTSPPVPRAPMPRHITTAGPAMPENTSRRTMDPGHDIIVISSETDSISSTSISTPLSSMSTTSATAPRLSNSTSESLDALRTELFASTQSFRERASELEELRTSPSATRTVPRGQESDPFAGLSPGLSRRAMLDYTMRQRAASESATSLGLMVAARASSSPSNPNNTSRRNFTPAFPAISLDIPTTPTAHNASPAETSLSPSHIPSGMASRVTRLAQEIQQDIARITQQSESLMAWINEHRARFDAATMTRASTQSSTAPNESSPTVSSDTVFEPSPSGLSITSVPHATTPTQRRRTSEIEILPVERSGEGRSTPQPTVVIPRRTSDVAVRARYLRQPVPSSWSTGSPVASGTREEGVASWSPSWRARQQGQDGPLSLPSRTFLPQVPGTTAGSTEAGASHRSIFEDVEFMETTSRVRLAIERVRASRREDEEANDTSNSRSYRVRRRHNAGGDEEVVRVPLRPELSPGFGEASEPAREETDDTEEEEEGNEAWIQALSRLDTLSRETAARDAARRASRGVSTANADGATSFMTRRSTRVWPRLTPRGEEGSTEEDEYERDIAAMRARARSLINSTAPPRTLGVATLPPPPPTTRPLSFVPTTQGTPGSLWNDSGVRVRIRAAAAHFDENMRRALDHSYFTGMSAAARPSAPSAAPERSSHHRTRAAARTQGKGAEAVKAQPMWGSPKPFHPSPLPLPAVDDVSSLQARSLAFVGAKKFAHQPRRRVLAEAGR
ncbi:hypothetical protein C8Q80DRAFT_1133446 [Daedaleopsis nitida]|nr:hypothetical protein C8Q80DRAFT_1133446 [Daedaleopsis nitida]